jgi:hypothetical protein
VVPCASARRRSVWWLDCPRGVVCLVAWLSSWRRLREVLLVFDGVAVILHIIEIGAEVNFRALCLLMMAFSILYRGATVQNGAKRVSM